MLVAALIANIWLIGLLESLIYPNNMSVNSLVIGLDAKTVLDNSVLEASMKANLTTSSAGLNGGFSAVRGHCKTLNSRVTSFAFIQPKQ